MAFKELSKAEFDALDVKAQVRYEMELEAHLKSQRDQEIKDAVAEALKGVDEKINTAKEDAKKEAASEAESKITAVKDEYDRKLESAEKAMQNAQSHNPSAQATKGLEDAILEKFEKSENKAQLVKDLLAGRAEIETESKYISKVISKPAGATAPQFIQSVWPGHDSMYGRELVRNYTTTRDTIKFNQYSVDDSLDGIGGVVQGDEKPEFGFDIETKSEAIIKIAGWVDYTEEMADDVDGFVSEIAREAVLAHADVFDYQFYKGNGNQTTQLHGLWYDAPVQSFPQGGVTSASNEIDKLVAGLTQIRKNHRGASAFVVAPTVWQDIYLNKSDENAYTYPILLNAQGVLTLGGVPVYWSNVFTDGQGIVGDFGRGAAVYTKKGLSLRISNENKDNFVKNVRTLLVESREAVVKRYADGFLKLDLGGSTT